MRHLAIILGLLIGVAAGRAQVTATLAEPVVGKVTTDKLNVRANPGTRYEVVAQLAMGSEVRILKVSEDWLGIAAPADAAAWVPARFLDTDTVIDDQVTIYSGPGVYYSTYGTLAKGQKVTVKRRKSDQWVQIEPPPDAVVWVYGKYIEHADFPAAERPAAAVANETDAEADAPGQPDGQGATAEAGATETGDGAVAEPELVTIGEATVVERLGYVIPLGSDRGPWRFALAQKIDETYHPIAYLSKDFPDLERWQWKRVTVKGTHRWYKGWPRPQIEIESLTLATASAPGE